MKAAGGHCSSVNVWRVCRRGVRRHVVRVDIDDDDACRARGRRTVTTRAAGDGIAALCLSFSTHGTAARDASLRSRNATRTGSGWLTPAAVCRRGGDILACDATWRASSTYGRLKGQAFFDLMAGDDLMGDYWKEPTRRMR